MTPRCNDAPLAIETWYAKLSDAVAKKDADALRALHLPNYTELQTTGEHFGLGEVVADWQQSFDDALAPNLQIEMESVAEESNAAVVQTKFRLSYQSGPFPSLAYDVVLETSRRERWELVGEEWSLREAEQTRVKSWINGKLVSDQELQPPLSAAEQAAIVGELKNYVQPLSAVLAGSGFDDLSGFGRLVGDARIVALGEASHGTAEFFQMKHRLLEYLVERTGFTVFAIEGNWPEAHAADLFIKTGDGDAASALAAMHFWTWQTEEVRDMLLWMRAYNMARSTPPFLSFAGFDMQFAAAAVESVIDFFHHIGADDRDTVHSLYEGIIALDKSAQDISTEEKLRLRDNAAKVFCIIEAKEHALLQSATHDEYRNALQAARIVLQAAQMHTGVLWAERDRAMAENVRWLLEERFPGEKIALWAHNGHVATRPTGGEPSLGMHLRGLYGSQMVVVGFASYEGEVRAKRIANGKFLPEPPAALPFAPARTVSAEAVFRETGLAQFLLDFPGIPKESALGQWLSKPQLHRSIDRLWLRSRSGRKQLFKCIFAGYVRRPHICRTKFRGKAIAGCVRLSASCSVLTVRETPCIDTM